MLQKIVSSKNIGPDHYVLQADAGGSAPSTNQGFNSMQPGAEQFVMKVPNNKVDFFFLLLLPSLFFLMMRLMLMFKVGTHDFCRLL